MLGALGGSKTRIVSVLTWALEVMLVPLTFLFYISLLCIKYIFVYVVISPSPRKQIMHQPMELSEFKY